MSSNPKKRTLLRPTMKKNYLIILLLLISVSLYAQMSDQQAIQELKRYQEAGLSQQQITVEMARKGITPVQLQRIREHYLKTQSSQATDRKGSETQGRQYLDENVILQPLVLPGDTIPQENKIYGESLFHAQNLTFAPNMNMPTPANYVLGAGDEIIIDVWGDSELNLQYTISPDGHITVPGIGRIQLSGMNVSQAESRIRTQFSTIYSDLDSSEPHTFLAISVGNVRSIRVNVMGEVKNPGTYNLNSFSSAFHAMYAAGGTTNIGSLRNIRIFRSGRQITEIDLYEYLMKGNNMEDITLQDGDIVMVEPYGILAQVKGEIRRPMWYEMKPNESLQDLLRYAGGFSGKAYKGTVTLQRSGISEKEVYTLSETEYPIFQLQDGDKVQVDSILSRFTNMVEISGSVYRPGKYAIGDRIKTVSDLIKIAQGTSGDAYLQRALLYRENDDLTRSMESFNLDDLLSSRIEDIQLKRNDLLYIPSVLSLDDSLSIYIGGEVRFSANYPFADNMNIEDIILQAGGLTEAASTARIDVYRRIKDPSSSSISDKNSDVFTFTLSEGEIISSEPDFVLQPFDQVIVRKSPGYEKQQIINLEGEVVFEGEYAKLTKDERISSLISRAGGLTPYAYAKGARLLRKLSEEEQQRLREAVRLKSEMDITSPGYVNVDSMDFSTHYVGIDLEKALQKPGSDQDIILLEGDVLNIPEYNATVKISGAVMYPNTVIYSKNKNLGYYIDQAGGYGRLAIKSRPFVVYMNGQVATGRRARIEPGCEIVVPEKPDREPMSLQGILSLGTTVASMAVLISNLVR